MPENSTTVEGTEADDFLAAIAELREDDQTVRTTAHTSSVSAEGWIVGGDASAIAL